MIAMIFAAGLGSRLKPLTNTKPKALVEINSKTLLEITICRLKKFGFTKFVINTHHFSGMIKEYLRAKNNFGVRIAISDESAELLDTGGGLLKAARHFKSTKAVLVHNVDIVSTLDPMVLINTHLENKAMATLAVRDRKTSRYLLFDENKQLAGWENRKTQEKILLREETNKKLEPLAFSGIHVINPKIVSFIKEKGKFSIIQAYLRLAKQHKIIAYEHNETAWADVGKVSELENIKNLSCY